MSRLREVGRSILGAVPARQKKRSRLADREVLLREEFKRNSDEINARHFQQTRETVVGLREKYLDPVIGRTHVWPLFDKLAVCIDPTDTQLNCTSQLTHALQVAEGMTEAGIRDDDLLVAALVHDLGKLLLLYGEAPENVVCFNEPIGDYEPGVGLDTCVFQWNHDEFLYSRLKDQVPDHISWLIRYHSIRIEPSEPYMDARDREYTEKYLRLFKRFDLGTKSMFRLPRRQIRDYRSLIEDAFPTEIEF